MKILLFIILIFLCSCASLPEGDHEMKKDFFADKESQSAQTSESVNELTADDYITIHVYPQFAGGNQYIKSAEIVVPFKTEKKKLLQQGKGVIIQK